MDTIPRKWFSLSEAFEHFGDPVLLRRLNELEPHARTVSKRTQHLHNEYRKTFRTIHESMIDRLKSGELIAHGLDKHGWINEGFTEIAPARWSVLHIRYDLGEVYGPGGLVLVDVQISEALDVTQQPQAFGGPDHIFEHWSDYRYVKMRGLEFKLGPKQAQVVKLLHAASQTDEPWVHGKVLLGDSIASKSVYELFKSKKNWRELIESDGHGRYRLNLAGNA